MKKTYILFLFTLYTFSGIAQSKKHSPFILQCAPYLEERNLSNISMLILEYSYFINSSDSILVRETRYYSDSSILNILPSNISDKSLTVNIMDIAYYEKQKCIYSIMLTDENEKMGFGILSQYDIYDNLSSYIWIVQEDTIETKKNTCMNFYDKKNRLIKHIEYTNYPYNSTIIIEYVLYDTLGYSMIKSIPQKNITYYFSQNKLMKIEKKIGENTKTLINTYDSIGRITIEEADIVRGNSYKQIAYTYDKNNQIATKIYTFDNDYKITEHYEYEYNTLGLIAKNTKKIYANAKIIKKNISFYHYY